MSELHSNLIIQRADNRIRAINWEIAHLENEKSMLEQIQQAESLGFKDTVADFMAEYKKLFKR